MVSFDDLQARGEYELRYKVPAKMMAKQLEYSLVEFARASGALQEYIVIPSFPSTSCVEVTPDSYPGYVSSIREVTIDGKVVHNSLYSFHENRAELCFKSSVSAAGRKVELVCVTVPSASYTDYPLAFFAAYGPGIVGHACFELSLDANEPWARPDRAPVFRHAYDRAVSEARRRNYKSFTLRA